MDRGRVTRSARGGRRGAPLYQEGADEQVNRRAEREVLRESVADGGGGGGAQFGQFGFGNIHTKRTNSGLVGCLLAALLCRAGGHGALLLTSLGAFGLDYL